jgi:hypothetical protein
LRLLKGESNGRDIATGIHALGEDLDSRAGWDADTKRAGVLNATDWSFTPTINSGTGALGSTAATGGAAWLPDQFGSGVLVRSQTIPAKLENLTGGLPASGKYMAISYALEATAWNAAASVRVIRGLEKNTQAEAEAAFPGAEHIVKVCDIVVKNTAGVYSIVFTRDRRPWANGAFSYIKRTAGTVAIPSAEFETAEALDPSRLSTRVECSGLPIRLALDATIVTNSSGGAALLGFWDNGVAVDGTGASGHAQFLWAGEIWLPFVIEYKFTPTIGSHLFQPMGRHFSGPVANLVSSNAEPLLFTVEEITRPHANNGNS